MSQLIVESDPPPAYGDVANRAPDLPLGNNEGTQLLPSPPANNENGWKQRTFNMRKFILLWLGIGHFYSCGCFLLHLLFFGGGVAVIVLMLVTGKGFGLQACPSLPAKVLTTAGGGAVILWALFWPCVWIWTRSDTQQHQRNFAPISCIAWLLSLVFVGIVFGLAVEVYHDYYSMENITECIPPLFRNITGCNLVHSIDCNISYVPLWTLTAMGGMIVIFVLVSCVLCGCLPLAGRVW